MYILTGRMSGGRVARSTGRKRWSGGQCQPLPTSVGRTRTTESDTTLSYLDVSISICQGKFITEVFDKRDNFNFNYPYMCSNIHVPAKPTYGVYISQLIRISRICDKFDSFVKRHRLLTDRLIKQGFWYSKLCSSFIKFARRHSAEICKYSLVPRLLPPSAQ